MTEGSETRPLGKPARVSGSRRETSVSEIRGYLEPSWPVRRKNGSTRALENHGHDLLLVTGGEEQEEKKKAGAPPSSTPTEVRGEGECARALSANVALSG